MDQDPQCPARHAVLASGHMVAASHRAVAAAGGSALVISADHDRGCLAGGADPRQDGIALSI